MIEQLTICLFLFEVFFVELKKDRQTDSPTSSCDTKCLSRSSNECTTTPADAGSSFGVPARKRALSALTRSLSELHVVNFIRKSHTRIFDSSTETAATGYVTARATGGESSDHLLAPREGEKHGTERGHPGTARMLPERVEVQTCCVEEFLIYEATPEPVTNHDLAPEAYGRCFVLHRPRCNLFSWCTPG